MSRNIIGNFNPSASSWLGRIYEGNVRGKMLFERYLRKKHCHRRRA